MGLFYREGVGEDVCSIEIMAKKLLLNVFLLLPAILLAEPLEIHPYDLIDVTVSGLSSGGYMATQMHVAFSSMIKGSAAFSSGPYLCSEGNFQQAIQTCMSDGTYLNQKTPELIRKATKLSKEKKIDPTKNLYDSKVFNFHGKLDTIVSEEVSFASADFFRAFVKPANIKERYDDLVNHCFPTIESGSPCDEVSSPFIGACNLDGAGLALQHLISKDFQSPAKPISSNLFEIDQTPFIPSNIDSSIDSSIGSTGFIYIPTSCQNGEKCHLHMALHGCRQQVDHLRNIFALETGFNEWAESNNIIILYPSTTSSPDNPHGCWDWYGYTGQDYANKDGVQMKFLFNLLTALGAKYSDHSVGGEEL